MAPLKPQKWEPTGNFKLHLTAPATREERNKTTPAVPMTQEPFQQIYEKRYFIQKHCLHKCVAFVQMLPIPTFLERRFNLGLTPSAVSCPWLRVAASEGGACEVGSEAFADHSQLCSCDEAYSRFYLPAEWASSSFYPSLQTPQVRCKPLVLPLAGFFQEGFGDQQCKSWASCSPHPRPVPPPLPTPTSSISKQGCRQRGEERRLGPDGGKGIWDGKSRNVGSSITHLKLEPPGWGPRGQGTPSSEQL